MIANYHTHTPRCMHAVGEERAYVKAAMEEGIQILGFSDHTPYLFPESYRSTFRMLPDQLPDYCETVRRLAWEYTGRVEIHLGVEMEYYPAFFAQTRAMLADRGVEYMLLGQHFLNNEMDAHYSGWESGSEEYLKRYCAQSMEAMQTGAFTYFAHPDLFFFRGEDRIYREHMRRLAQEAKSCGLPLEINLLGLGFGRNYPDRRFWELAAEEGCPVILGCDAHAPDQLKVPEMEKKALAMVRELGLTLLDQVELRKIQ